MSNTKYIGYYFKVSPLQPATEILIAELGYVGFESFVETENGVNAFIQSIEWEESILEGVYVLNSGEFDIEYTIEEIEQINWNKEWEKNFNPIVVDGICSVRAPFHEKPNTKYDIIIEPKMSFGTGHHETTHMMIQHILKTDLNDKTVLDMGCGTGVLAILAKMRGAGPTDAIDIDNWCYLNTVENVERNNCEDITAYEGDASLLSGKKYDVIIANINRNILLNDIQQYVKSLSPKGKLFLSGFYKEDLDMITEECTKNHLDFIENFNRNNWIAASYELK
ncbi:ribosomal protein L11 methyltransferase [Aquimarina sp. EL_43]|uniref:50S ribosomal protein L11 methyltransferase n=1 Tax=unclassified Aquimarina TaxID=2627091 RepID=UPI0018CA524F|nr:MULTISPECIES: 50S ribosomal protein L11 methyltransferase [unclassified Aquimarina]MBG6131023.1 ribosomal protein L11 methyltransferase [Aquimarina sp. EL_35]MBG6151482.1 ribosomal protein L11 methyltransferase [Aquimarina sp. EL_32]MBG6169413.1 ribosomal protein L11 methyltransferase [Aquimarina sp. EL_43]